MCEILRNKNSIAPSNFICVFISVLLWTSASDVVTGIHHFLRLFQITPSFWYAFTCMNGFCSNEWMPTKKAIGRAMCGPAFFIIRSGTEAFPMWQVNSKHKKQPYGNLFNASPSFENNGNSTAQAYSLGRYIYLSALSSFCVQSKQNQQNINIMLKKISTIWKHTAAAKWILCLISSIQLHLKDFFVKENLLVSLDLKMNPKSSRFSIATKNCVR